MPHVSLAMPSQRATAVTSPPTPKLALSLTQHANMDGDQHTKKFRRLERSARIAADVCKNVLMQVIHWLKNFHVEWTDNIAR